MAALQPMPKLDIDKGLLAEFGRVWLDNGGKLKRSPPFSSIELGQVFDQAVAKALSMMLGNIAIVKPTGTALLPPQRDCVELGSFRVIGGVRPQNFDVGYRPDGVRFAFDSKTLNDSDSVRKNYQNMINDLATEATSVHSRFPYAVVAFLVAIPHDCLGEPQRSALIGTLERLTGRTPLDEADHRAEAISLVIWDPATGEIDTDTPNASSLLRTETFSEQVERAYNSRYKGLPPHTD